jgi:N-acetylmuramoyl-L-alanine amidase/putative methionine-R-sulfoxide reductase with GAF domain
LTRLSPAAKLANETDLKGLSVGTWPVSNQMATTPTKPEFEIDESFAGDTTPSWPREEGGPTGEQKDFHQRSFQKLNHDLSYAPRPLRPSGGDALQALLAFSAMHQQVRQRRALASKVAGIDITYVPSEFEPSEQFVLDEVLQLVVERAIAITGADGLGIALAQNSEIVLRASAGSIKPDVGARIERDSAFSGACFRTAQIIRCDDTETDDRVNLNACRRLGARSMVAVPLCGRKRVIGVLEAFSAEPFGFNDSDVNSLELLAELVLAALKPEDEDRFAAAAQLAEVELAAPETSTPAALPATVAQASVIEAPKIDAPKPVPVESSAKNEERKDKDKDKDKVEASEFISVVAEAAVPTTVSVVTEPAADETLPVETLPLESIAEPVPARHPGMVLVLVLLVLSVLVAGGVWWKLKTAQLSNILIKPEERMAVKPLAKSADVSTSPGANASSGSQEQTTGISPDSSTETIGNPAPHDPAKLPRITGIRHWSSADSSTVVLDLEDQVQYEAHRLSNPDRIYFDLHDTALAAELEGKTIDIGDALLARVRVAQPSTSLTRVVLETKNNSTYSVSLEPNPYRLVVQVQKLGGSAKPLANLFPDAGRDKLAIVIPPPGRDDLQLRAHVSKMRIVVDAGHGGWDLGTVGRRGLLEKDLVLEIAQRLGKLLESRLGAEVILTRNDDNYIPLDERAGMANQAQADLFVSVHANYSDLPSARGVETYYTNFFSAPNAKDIETRSGANGAKPATAALSPADLHERIEQSRRLAASVQRSLYGTLSADNPGLRDRGVKEASYVVLTETAMPGILAEVSFVSSPTDEQKLRSDGYREQIAEALYKGIAHYAASSHSVKVAAR